MTQYFSMYHKLEKKVKPLILVHALRKFLFESKLSFKISLNISEVTFRRMADFELIEFDKFTNQTKSDWLFKGSF